MITGRRLAAAAVGAQGDDGHGERMADREFAVVREILS